jgi:hypothetical protein
MLANRLGGAVEGQVADVMAAFYRSVEKILRANLHELIQLPC